MSLQFHRVVWNKNAINQFLVGVKELMSKEYAFILVICPLRSLIHYRIAEAKSTGMTASRSFTWQLLFSSRGISHVVSSRLEIWCYDLGASGVRAPNNRLPDSFLRSFHICSLHIYYPNFRFSFHRDCKHDLNSSRYVWEEFQHFSTAIFYVWRLKQIFCW